MLSREGQSETQLLLSPAGFLVYTRHYQSRSQPGADLTLNITPFLVL